MFPAYMILAEMCYRVDKEKHDARFSVEEIIEIFLGKIDGIMEKLCWLDFFGGVNITEDKKEVILVSNGLHLGQNPKEPRVMKSTKTIYESWLLMRRNFLKISQ